VKGSDFPAEERQPSLLAPQGSCANAKAWGHHLNSSVPMHAGCTPARASPRSCPGRLTWRTWASSVSRNHHSLLNPKWHWSHAPLSNNLVQVPLGQRCFRDATQERQPLSLKLHLLPCPSATSMHLLDESRWSWTKGKATLRFVMVNVNGLWHNWPLWGGLSHKVGIIPPTL